MIQMTQLGDYLRYPLRTSSSPSLESSPLIIKPIPQMLFGAFPIVFEQLRGWTPGVSGLAFLGVLVGFLLALLATVFYFNKQYSSKLEKEGGWLPPEQRLLPAIVGGILLPWVRMLFKLSGRTLTFLSSTYTESASSLLHGLQRPHASIGSHLSYVQCLLEQVSGRW